MKNKFHYIKNLNLKDLSEAPLLDLDVIINQRKGLFPNFDFLVYFNNKEKYSKVNNFDNLYIINIVDNSFINSNDLTELKDKENIIYENIYLNKVELNKKLKFNNCKNLYVFSSSLSNDFIFNDFYFDVEDKLNFFYFCKPQDKKLKVDFTFNLNNFSALNSDFLIYAKEGQLEDNYITVNHTKESVSNVNYLSLNSGRVNSQVESIIPKDAHSSETHQNIKHFLLNNNSISNSKPTLIIENPDVIASHGNSIGSFNKDEIFYLQQRGFSINNAEKIIIQSMISEFFSKTNFEKEFLKLWSNNV